MATKKRSTRGATRSPNSRPGLPASVLLGSGFISGVIATVLVFKAVDGDRPSPTPATKTAAKTAEPAAAETSAANNTKFDFFTLLPEREVIVPDETPKAETKAPPPSNDSVAEAPQQPPRPPEKTFQTGEQYTLQAGSFRTNADAESRRAQILLLALDARVETVEINGERWHRVHVGPFLTHNTLSEARAKLIAEGIDTLVIRRKN